MWCKNCGKELEDGSRFCIACGTEQSQAYEPQRTSDYSNMQEKEKTIDNPQQIPPVNQQQSNSKKKLGIAGIIAVFIVASIFSAIGKKAGKAVVGAVEEKSAEQEIEEFVEFVSKYEAGTCTETNYKSDFWGLRFDTNDSWIMCTDDERATLTEQLRASSEDGMRTTAENMGVSENLVNKMIDAFYAETEMAAGYSEYGYLVGEATMNIMCLYEVTDMSEEELLLEMTTQHIGSQVSDVEYGEQVIAGEKYASIKMVIPTESGNIIANVFMRIKDSMVCTINCKYYEGFEYVLDSFLEQCSSY